MNLGAALGAFAMAATAAHEPTAALLYAYHVASPALFDAAYADHLEWHRRQRDQLTWYAWYVIAGRRTGQFVDGAFGSRFEAFDRRPDPRGDAAHFAQGAAGHSRPAQTSAWQLWPEASTVFTLEQRTPTAMVDLLLIEVEPARADAFEAHLLRLAGGGSAPSDGGWTWYRSRSGSAHPGYMVMIPRRSWAALEDRPQSLGALAAARYGVRREDGAPLDAMVRRLESETWRYRADLSYFPEAPGPR